MDLLASYGSDSDHSDSPPSPSPAAPEQVTLFPLDPFSFNVRMCTEAHCFQNSTRTHKSATSPEAIPTKGAALASRLPGTSLSKK
jgi:hypothetical protein